MTTLHTDITVPECWKELLDAYFPDGLEGMTSGDRKQTAPNDPTPYYDDFRQLAYKLADGTTLRLTLASGQENYYAGFSIDTTLYTVAQSSNDDPIERFDLSPIEGANGTTYTFTVFYEPTLPEGSVYALAHPQTSDSYFGFGWRVVERTPLALVIGGPPEHASLQITRLFSGLRGMGHETYPTKMRAKAAIITLDRLDYTTKNGKFRIYERNDRFYLVHVASGREANMGDGVSTISTDDGDGGFFFLKPGTWLFNVTFAADLERSQDEYASAYFPEPVYYCPRCHEPASLGRLGLMDEGADVTCPSCRATFKMREVIS